MSSERSVKIVRGHVPLERPSGAEKAGLVAAVGIVLSTYRSDAEEMVHDHPLWFACMHAVTRVVRATTTAVYAASERRFLEQFRTARLGAPLGSLDEYYVRVRRDTSSEHDAGDLWQTVEWLDAPRLLAVGGRECWYTVGGPDPYHDSDTTSILVRPQHVDELVREIAAAIAAVDGRVEAIVDIPSTG